MHTHTQAGLCFDSFPTARAVPNKARNLEFSMSFSSRVGGRVSRMLATPCCLPRLVSRGWTQVEQPGLNQQSDVGCWHRRWRMSGLRHHTRPRNFF